MWKKIEGFSDSALCGNLQLEDENRYMELPYADMTLHNFAWLRTWHGGKPHFDYQFNKDGSISPSGRLDLVFGLADPTPCVKWRDVIAKHVSWNTRRPLQ